MDCLLSDQMGNWIHSIPFPIWLAFSHSEVAISVSIKVVKQVKFPKEISLDIGTFPDFGSVLFTHRQIISQAKSQSLLSFCGQFFPFTHSASHKLATFFLINYAF